MLLYLPYSISLSLVTLSHCLSFSVTVSLSEANCLRFVREWAWCMRTETLNWSFNRVQTPAVSHFTPQLSVKAALPCRFKLREIGSREVKRPLVAEHQSGSRCFKAGASLKLIFSGLYTCMVVRGDQRSGEGRTGKQSEEGRERCRKGEGWERRETMIEERRD